MLKSTNYTGINVPTSKCETCKNLVYEEETHSQGCPYFDTDIKIVAECGMYKDKQKEREDKQNDELLERNREGG